MRRQHNATEQEQHLGQRDKFELSVDDLLAQLALDNYSLVPCQD